MEVNLLNFTTEILIVIWPSQVECVRLECSDSSDCTNDKACIDFHCIDPCTLPNVCGPQSDCIAANHVGVCSCQPGTTGDPVLGCVSVQYCGADSQCPTGTVCNNGICKCKKIKINKLIRKLDSLI